MTDGKKRRLAIEILGDLATALASAVFLFVMLFVLSLYIADGYLFAQNIELTDTEFSVLSGWIVSLSLILSVVLFVILFILLLGQRLSYIPTIMKGITSLQAGDDGYEVPIENNNELTELARAINYLSETQKSVRAEEMALQAEKEMLVRSLSHDIRTPLTSIMSYSELLATNNELSEKERRTYFELIRKKSEQIKELTDILLDGGARSLELFENGALLMAQLADDFESSLEDRFDVSLDQDYTDFSGRFDLRELQRIFDNLISNIEKYADASKPVVLTINASAEKIVIKQENYIRKDAKRSEGFGIGLKSIGRIAGLYGGDAEVHADEEKFEITVIFTDFK